MAENTEIITDDEVDPEKIQKTIKQKQPVSTSIYRDVYEGEDHVYKIHDQYETPEAQRRGSYLNNKIAAETAIRTINLENSTDYQGKKTVVIQEKYDQKLTEKLEKEDHDAPIGDFIHLLDSIVDLNAVMDDPILDNFNYFSNELKVTDLDETAIKKFPQSFDQHNSPEQYKSYTESMYKYAIASLAAETELSTEKTSEIFQETSRYIKEIKLEETFNQRMPKVEIFNPL